MSRDHLFKKPWDFAGEARKKIAWKAIALRVIKGDYNKADDSTRTSLSIGLRGYNDPDCKTALAMIEKL